MRARAGRQCIAMLRPNTMKKPQFICGFLPFFRSIDAEFMKIAESDSASVAFSRISLPQPDAGRLAVSRITASPPPLSAPVCIVPEAFKKLFSRQNLDTTQNPGLRSSAHQNSVLEFAFFGNRQKAFDVSSIRHLVCLHFYGAVISKYKIDFFAILSPPECQSQEVTQH